MPSSNSLPINVTPCGTRRGGENFGAGFAGSGAQSLRVNLRNNARALRVFKDGSAPDEQAFRSRYLNAFKAGVALRELPDAPKAASKDRGEWCSGHSWLRSWLGVDRHSLGTNAGYSNVGSEKSIKRTPNLFNVTPAF